ncbi:antirestriction protein [Asticcacaulis sp. YBE204]|uniref:antirestriction protein n=1 Tax=Asticcacaulis sp. YBE204 TaxID=1282363 RepID=UPI0003C410CD|nr:antirestriction protein [Asticcacaulis sp. YBE204]ESQ79256.1 hypothetical protein AEYBE204_09610 [Asticcacaulis sp. YBE204]
MGWTFHMTMGGHRTPKAFLDAEFTWSNDQADNRVLRSSVVGRVYYAAVERISRIDGARIVFAVVTLFRHTPKNREDYVFGCKEMDETVGPCERRCPSVILELLTPTQHEYAVCWRADCRTNLATTAAQRRKPRPSEGDIVELAEALRFTDGAKLTRFQAVHRYGRRQLVYASLENGGLYRLSGLSKRAYTLTRANKEKGRDEGTTLTPTKEPTMSSDVPETAHCIPIFATPVAEEARPNALPKLFGRWFMKAEAVVYAFMTEMAPEYTGGLWDFYTLSNGGGFMAPRRTEPLAMKWHGNGFASEVSPEAAGIIVTLFTLSHLSFSDDATAVFTENYARLYAYAVDHPEAVKIYQAID